MDKTDVDKIEWKLPKEIPLPPDDLNDPFYDSDPRMKFGPNKVTSMATWLPEVEHFDFVPVTYMEPVPYRTYLQALDFIDKQDKEGFEGLMEKHLAPAIRMMECTLTGEYAPIFVKSWFFSAKHEVSTTRIQSKESLVQNVAEIVYESCLRDLPFGGLAFRQFLHLKSTFSAFGGLPIAREARVFVSKGGFEPNISITPYWPEKAILFSNGVKEPKNWKSDLQLLNHLSLADINTIKARSLDIYLQIRHHHPNWSLDFAQDVSGKWWFIDAAAAETSWRPEPGDFPYRSFHSVHQHQ